LGQVSRYLNLQRFISSVKDNRFFIVFDVFTILIPWHFSPDICARRIFGQCNGKYIYNLLIICAFASYFNRWNLGIDIDPCIQDTFMFLTDLFGNAPSQHSLTLFCSQFFHVHLFIGCCFLGLIFSWRPLFVKVGVSCVIDDFNFFIVHH
jgi:hypothetical protein